MFIAETNRIIGDDLVDDGQARLYDKLYARGARTDDPDMPEHLKNILS